MDAPGFWIFMGLVVLALIWAGSRERVEKQRTLQRLLERNEEIDEDLVNRLLARPFWKPGTTYRRLRAIGAFGMVVSIPVGGLAFAAVASEDNTPLLHAKIRQYMRYLSGHADDGDDLAQQVLVRAWKDPQAQDNGSIRWLAASNHGHDLDR